jgi:hypothetical protein
VTRRAHLARSDAGLVVVSTAVKLLLTLAVVATAGYDSISMLATHMTAQNDADQAALAGNIILDRHGSQYAAYEAVVASAQDNGDVVVPSGFAIGPNNAVTVELRRQAHTLVASHLPRIKDYTVVTVTSTVSDAVG